MSIVFTGKMKLCFGISGNWNEGKPVPRGGLADDDDVETTHILPDKADMFLAFATVPGYR